MSTHFIVKERIPQNHMDIILSLFKSWDIDVKVEKVDVPKTEVSTLSFSAGLWSDYDIDDQTLRKKAWGTYKRVDK